MAGTGRIPNLLFCRFSTGWKLDSQPFSTAEACSGEHEAFDPDCHAHAVLRAQFDKLKALYPTNKSSGRTSENSSYSMKFLIPIPIFSEHVPLVLPHSQWLPASMAAAVSLKSATTLMIVMPGCQSRWLAVHMRGRCWVSKMQHNANGYIAIIRILLMQFNDRIGFLPGGGSGIVPKLRNRVPASTLPLLRGWV